MTKLLMIAVSAAISVGANAADVPHPPAGGPGFGGDHKGGFMQNLTEEQKACIEKANCPKLEMKKQWGDEYGARERGEKPQRPEMTYEEKAAMEASHECMKKSFADCGIEMPERLNGMGGGRNGKPQQ